MTNQTAFDDLVDPVLVGVRLSSVRGLLEAYDGVLAQIGEEVSATVRGQSADPLPDHVLELLDSVLDNLPEVLDVRLHELALSAGLAEAEAERSDYVELLEEAGHSGLDRPGESGQKEGSNALSDEKTL